MNQNVFIILASVYYSILWILITLNSYKIQYITAVALGSKPSNTRGSQIKYRSFGKVVFLCCPLNSPTLADKLQSLWLYR